MAIYAIGDLHFSVAAKKPMDIFAGWDNHAEKIIQNWQKKIKQEDTVVLAGDTSWGMTLQQALPDFRLIHKLPGTKLILKGNHDYWWGSVAKMTGLFEQNGLDTLHILHNNSFFVEGVNICGSRGWMFESGEPHDDKIIKREAIRIEASLKAAEKTDGETILFLHYPPLYAGQVQEPFMELMRKYSITRCYYGHIHGVGHKYAIQGNHRGIAFHMISSDAIGFNPVCIQP